MFLKHRSQSRIPGTEKGYLKKKLGSGKPAAFFLHIPISREGRSASPPEFSASRFSRIFFRPGSTYVPSPPLEPQLRVTSYNHVDLKLKSKIPETRKWPKGAILDFVRFVDTPSHLNAGAPSASSFPPYYDNEHVCMPISTLAP